MKLKKFAAVLLLFALIMYSCGDDDYVYPNLVTEMIDVQTDSNGAARYLITDGGTTWSIHSDSRVDGLVADTIYRTVTKYALVTDTDTSEQEAKLYSITLIVSPIPVPESTFQEIKTDAVDIQSIWRGGNYLNMVLEVMIKDQTHTYHFIENKLESKDDGTHTLYLTLYHNRNNDIEGYTSTVYLSVPLWAYADTLNEGDSIVFSLNTYEEGETSRTFTY